MASIAKSGGAAKALDCIVTSCELCRHSLPDRCRLYHPGCACWRHSHLNFDSEGLATMLRRTLVSSSTAGPLAGSVRSIATADWSSSPTSPMSAPSACTGSR